MIALRGEDQAAIEHRIMHGTKYRGIQTLKMPMDAWVYQELLDELRPEVVVEIGNRFGGSLLMLADLRSTLHLTEGSIIDCRVIGVDIDHSSLDPFVLADSRIELVTDDAIAAYLRVERMVAGRSCLVIEDSAHTYSHTLAVLRLYSELVQPGGYLICEDGVMPPVAEALAAFAAEQSELVADRAREWPITWNPNGYLRRVA